ncbi:MAG: hypothetical protein PHH52_01795 [Patescibacteria group bacterium]|nr:hypothetical protein [Patescibacteria group bacterium]MDD3778093.1 hypothetical protein [Patescibacteria group bacterium]MDD3939060.1 hypothetical protein [Patescibacteria group bacterium]NCU39293.1 hypothetical protein [Candidatus Falkowbacteria bacterium]
MGKKVNESYIFSSGRYKNKSLEWVFINDPFYVGQVYSRFYLYRYDDSVRKDEKLELAIYRLRQKIRNLEVNKKCPFCHKNKVHFFLLPDVGTTTIKLTCCKHPVCQERLRAFRAGTLYPINDFLSVIPFVAKREGKTVIQIFRKTYDKVSLLELI